MIDAPHRERVDLLLWRTLCLTLLLATVGIVGLDAIGRHVAKEVSLAVAAQWGSLLAVAYRLSARNGRA